MDHNRAMNLLKEIIYFKEQLEIANDIEKRLIKNKIAWREQEIKDVINGVLK